MISRQATPSDISGILALQKLYLHRSLSPEERKSGFVTTPFSREQIQNRVENNGLFVTEEGGQIIAYVFAGKWEFFEQWPIFPYMTSRFSNLKFQDFDISTASTFQYGPVCVDLAYRGKKVFNAVFEEMRLEWRKKFPLSITFINSVNEVSVKAHAKLGWEVIDRFSFNDNQYLTLAFDMNKSVL
ncbi:MAG: GNAT family acetyltransferase [Cyclobacteriaceae bacterium]